MAWRLALQYAGIALIAVGCAASGTGASGTTSSGASGTTFGGGSSSMSAEEATRCAQTGGRWNGALATCERGAGGGGGY